MTALVVNSAESLQSCLGTIRELWNSHKFLRLNIKTGKDRSLPQNNFTHAWYEQLARELREYDALGWKCFCKLHFGVPLLRAEDEEFRSAYDVAVKSLGHEQKIEVMKFWPVTSLMTTDQLTRYAEEVRKAFANRGVMLEVA